MKEIEALEAEFRAITRKSKIVEDNLETLSNVKRELIRIVEDPDYNDEFREQAAGLVAEIIEFKLALVVSESPERIERYRQESLARLQGRAERQEYRKNSKAAAQ